VLQLSTLILRRSYFQTLKQFESPCNLFYLLVFNYVWNSNRQILS